MATLTTDDVHKRGGDCRVVFASEDFPDCDECPTPQQLYRLVQRKTTDPRARQSDGWSLTDRDGRVHCGWLQERFRAEIEAQIAAAELFNAGQEEEDHIIVEIEVGNLFKAYDDPQDERDADGRVFNRG
ncbi:hypothetical protein EG328_006422 [Venturia inaequalis]|uniref:Uncharacterized protein n=1 Tax=Venturia inaequalis TaxID=5025 RepID=A0A8H3VBX8_VENIN|nr:hypothetical protein EG328_006422 [Venturia inaequalis]